MKEVLVFIFIELNKSSINKNWRGFGFHAYWAQWYVDKDFTSSDGSLGDTSGWGVGVSLKSFKMLYTIAHFFITSKIFYNFSFFIKSFIRIFWSPPNSFLALFFYHLRNVGQSSVQPSRLVRAQSVDDLLKTASVNVQTQEVEEKPFACQQQPLTTWNLTYGGVQRQSSITWNLTHGGA